MNILIAVETLLTGGAETFSLRLAQALSKNNSVVLYRFYHDYIDQDIANTLAPDVQLMAFTSEIDTFLRKLDSVLVKLKIDFSLRNWFIKQDLQRIIRKKKIAVVHSNQFKVDFVVTTVAAANHIPVITTIHGDYLKFWQQAPASILHYQQKLVQCVSRTNFIACISEKQLAFFRNQVQPLVRKALPLVKIYNGYPFHPTMLQADGSGKYKLKIPDDHFIFGMVSRGIPEKGWEAAIQAFIALNAPASHLVLVGDSAYLNQLKAAYSKYKQIHFVGYAPEPLEWIIQFDVGLLPSVYASESLPTVVIEYLFCGKPVVASDVGEIANMLDCNSPAAAGTVVPVINNQVAVNTLRNAMQQYLQYPELYQQHKKNTIKAAAKFDMQTCINRYQELYKKNETITT